MILHRLKAQLEGERFVVGKRAVGLVHLKRAGPEEQQRDVAVIATMFGPRIFGIKTVTQDKDEAELIARLLADDRKRKVGLVYLWNTSELGILWIEERDAASFIEPPLHPELLAKAKSETPVEVIDLLAALSTKAGNDPG